MLHHVAALLVVFQLGTQPVPPNEVADALSRAQALYYEAKFKDSADVLLRIDELLSSRPDRLQEKLNVKLQLSLAYIGINDAFKAKAFLRDLYGLDADYVLDPTQFSPKVISLAAEAKAEQSELRCQAVRDDARKKLDAGNGKAVLDLIASMKSKCSGLNAFEAELAEVLYKTGFEAYKRGELSAALQNFQATLRLSPKHELATQYTDLTQSKLQVNADRLFIQWQKNFDSREFVQAAADYRHLVSFNDESNTQLIAQAKSEYRKTLTSMVDSFNKACISADTAGMNAIRTQISELLPDPSFGEDVRAKMTTCTKTGCLDMSAQLAMARLKTRVNPDISPALQSFIRGNPVTVRVKARIDESGNVTVSDAQGTNPSLNSAVRTAVEKWKFSPIIDQNGSRCVDTEIPIVVGAAGSSTRP
jgi:tetratricopeptide (TPR) repeat protein